MERELGSVDWDLPHEFTPNAIGMCECSRSEAHQLHHGERITETAAATGPALITEKGS